MMRWLVALGGVVLVVSEAWAQGTTTPGVPSDFGWKDGITLAIAVLGAVLGILNYWNTVSARRLRVAVQPAHAILIGEGDGEMTFSIGVVNLSAFPVNVAEIGFMDPRRNGARYSLPPHIFCHCMPPPLRLDPRDAVSFYFKPYRTFPIGTKLGLAYVRLASGEVITGKSPALKQLQDEVGRPDH